VATVRKAPRLYYAFGLLFIVAVAVRLLGFYFFAQKHELRWVAAALVGAFTLLYATERYIARWFPAYIHLYLVLQNGLALLLMLLPPSHFFAAGLGLVLSAQAVLLLPGRQAYAWIGAITGVMLFGLVRGQGLFNGLTLGLLYVAGYLLTGAYAAAVGKATGSQERSEALLADLQEAHEHLRAYAAQAEQVAVVEERQRLARDLHDSVIQALYGMVLSAESAARKLAEGQFELVGERLKDIRRTAQTALREMRILIFELRPPELSREGLVAALRTRLDAVEARAGMKTSLLVEGDGTLSAELEAGLYQVVQEALNNMLKHSGAQNVAVSLRVDPSKVELEVSDDGVGFNPSTVEAMGGLGLRGLRERAERMGGRLSLQTQPNRGTRITLEVPR
jgi:signal transduction histidine kinase